MSSLFKKHKISQSLVVYSDLFINNITIQKLFKNLKSNFKIYKFSMGELNVNNYYFINNCPNYVDQILEKKFMIILKFIKIF